MFEKEAEEYVKDWIVEEDVSDLMREAYKDGAEFGYNKANEWHDLRKNPNDLPNVTDEVLVCYKNGYIDTCLYLKEFKHEAVIGWKYLPKPLN